jgi:hypothetical protein
MHILGYGFCTKHHILAQFYHMLLPLNALKISLQKLLSFGTKNLGDIGQVAAGLTAIAKANNIL